MQSVWCLLYSRLNLPDAFLFDFTNPATPLRRSSVNVEQDSKNSILLERQHSQRDKANDEQLVHSDCNPASLGVIEAYVVKLCMP